MRIEEFLFNQNIEPTFAESLVADFPDLSFNTFQEFYDFFESQGIKLVKQTRQTLPEREELLERFKNFKSSTDYDYVKKYILEERKIREEMSKKDFVPSETLLSGISGGRKLDPFFNFIVKKILTGSENGVLPSEQLNFLIEELKLKNKKDIDTEPDVQRDSLKRVQSFDNYLKNKGSIRVELLDERFQLETFRYVVTDKNFKSLQGAIDAERNAIRRANEILTLPTGGSTTAGEFRENLRTLISGNSNSVTALQIQIEQLNKRLENSDTHIDSLQETIQDYQTALGEINSQASDLIEKTVTYEETIDKLNETIDTTLTEVEENVAAQLENTADAFDALNERLEEQNRLAEERAAAQLDAFSSAIDKIVSGLKPQTTTATGGTGTTGTGTTGTGTTGTGTTGTGNTGTSGTGTSGTGRGGRVGQRNTNANDTPQQAFFRDKTFNFLNYPYKNLSRSGQDTYFLALKIIGENLQTPGYNPMVDKPTLPNFLRPYDWYAGQNYDTQRQQWDDALLPVKGYLLTLLDNSSGPQISSLHEVLFDYFLEKIGPEDNGREPLLPYPTKIRFESKPATTTSGTSGTSGDSRTGGTSGTSGGTRTGGTGGTSGTRGGGGGRTGGTSGTSGRPV